MKSNLGKLAIVAVLIIIVAGVILVKQQTRRENGNKGSVIGDAEASSENSIPKPSARASQPEEGQEIITTTNTSEPTEIRQNEKSEEMQIDKNNLYLS